MSIKLILQQFILPINLEDDYNQRYDTRLDSGLVASTVFVPVIDIDEGTTHYPTSKIILNIGNFPGAEKCRSKVEALPIINGVIESIFNEIRLSYDLNLSERKHKLRYLRGVAESMALKLEWHTIYAFMFLCIHDPDFAVSMSNRKF